MLKASTAIFGTLSILALITFAAAQSTKTVTVGEDTRSFNISRGSSFSASVPTNREKAPSISRIKAIGNDFDEALEIVKENSVVATRQGDAKLLKAAIGSMLLELDPHSSFYTRSEFQELYNEQRGRYFGTGMTISNFKQDGRVGTYVLSVAKGSPAERAGFRFGDQIVRVDRVDVTDANSENVRDMVRGNEGSVVTITYARTSDGPLNTVQVRRAKLPESSIPTAMMLDNKTGYIALTEGFHYTTATEFGSALARLKLEGMRALIVDLRGNGGGLLEQAIRIAEKFLPAGRVIVSQRGRYAAEGRVWLSNNKLPETVPLVLLVDENTASASEVFAGAMQDNDRATIVGARTFGKGLVQDVIPLEDGSGLVLTSERYYAPSGRSLQREYSDSGLYDYFRHVKSGVLIDLPQMAARTLKGRVVYGGDGIQPDVQIPTMTWSEKDLADYEKAFFIARENQSAANATISENVRRHVLCFNAIATGDKDHAARLTLDADAQFRTALDAATKVSH